MTDQKPNLRADHGQVSETGGTLQEVKPSGAEQKEEPGTKDTGGFVADSGSDQQQQEGWDPHVATFSSPFYDPFGDSMEAEIEVRAPGERQGTTVIEAYNSTGAHRQS